MVASNDAPDENIGAYEELAFFLKYCLDEKKITHDRYKSLLDDIDHVAAGASELDTTDWGDETCLSGNAFLNVAGIERVRKQHTVSDYDQAATSTAVKKDDNEYHKAGRKTQKRLSYSTQTMPVTVDEALANIQLIDIRKDTSDVHDMLREPNHNCYKVERPIIYRAMLYGYTSPWDLEERYSLDMRKLQSWITDISELYQHHPYHNWNHAWDVYQFAHLTLDRGGSNYFNFQDILALLVSMIAHDVAHPGRNNPFLIGMREPLAMTYNDFSPLEMMHASTAFRTMSKPHQNFLGHFKDAEYRNVRQKIVDAILATDNKHHFELVDRFKTRVSKVESQAAPFTQNTKEDRQKQQSSKEDRRLLMQAWIHMADISGCMRTWDNHSAQAEGLEKEFFQQGDVERKKGKPVSFLCDRNKDSLAAGQGFWISGMVGPLFQPFSVFIDDELKGVFSQNMADNKKAWEVLLEKHGRKTASEILNLLRLEQGTGAPTAESFMSSIGGGVSSVTQEVKTGLFSLCCRRSRDGGK